MATHNEKMNILIGAKDTTAGVLKSIKNQIIGIGAAYLGWRTASDFIGDSIKEAAKYEATMKSLKSVVGVTGRDMNEVYREMRGHLGGLATDANVAEGFLKGMTTELNVKQISNLTQAVKDASIAMGEDFNTQLPLIIKAIKQLNPAILDNIGVTVRLDQVNQKIKSGYYGADTALTEYTQQNAIYQEIIKQTLQYQGQEQAYLETAEGRWKSLTTAITNFKKGFGEWLDAGGIAGGVIDALTGGFKGWGQFLSSDITLMEFLALELARFGGNTETVNNILAKFDENGKRVKKTINGMAYEMKQFADHCEIVFEKTGEDAEDSGEKIVEYSKRMFNSEADYQAQLAKRVEIYDFIKTSGEQIVENWNAEYQEIDDIEAEYEDASYERAQEQFAVLQENLARKMELIRLGLSEEELARLEAYELEYTQQQEQDELMTEQMMAQKALELGISREALEEMLNQTKEKYQAAMQYINQYARQIEAGFRSGVQKMVADSSLATMRIKTMWESLGRAVKTVLADMVVDAIVQVVSAIFSKMIPSLVADAVTTRMAAAAAASHAAALAAVQPWTAPARIAAATSVKSTLMAMAGFDDPVNDAVAFRHGKDYADNFMMGVQTRFAAPGFGVDMVDNVSRLPSPMPTSSSSSTVHLHFNGPVTSEQFVRDSIIPAIEDARHENYTRIVLDEDNLTGRQEVRL